MDIPSTDSRKIIVYARPEMPLVQVAEQLLNGAGFAVHPATSADEACEISGAGDIELMILGGDIQTIGDTLDRVALLPTAQRPRRVAVLSNEGEDDHALLTRKLPGTKMTVLAGPMQAFGLLSLVKAIQGKVIQHN